MRPGKCLLLVPCIFSFLIVLGTAWAVPGLINYQGVLTDSDGLSLNGIYTIHFYLYDSAAGGTSLWDEEKNVSVNNGIYNVQLGTSNSLGASVFSEDEVYLEVRVKNYSTATWETFSPRQRLTCTAYAFQAENADTLQGRGPEDFASTGHTHSFSEITGQATDAQIPDDITIDNAKNAYTLGGHGPSEFALASHTHSGYDITRGIVVQTYIDPDITRDSELVEALDTKADVNHKHDDRYYTKAHVDALEARIAALEAKLASMSVSPDGKQVTFSGVNVHIVNGKDRTDIIDPDHTGNLIVGYNESRVPFGETDDRTSSHNIIVGKLNNYSSYGGIVAGFHNTISGVYSSVSGGESNTASGAVSSVSGGYGNTASEEDASVTGGYGNTASAYAASVSGGKGNTASGFYASVSGGGGNRASAEYAAVSGGEWNAASAEAASVSGGSSNTASAEYAAVTGGSSNTASGQNASIAGGLNNKASGRFSFVGGGGNTDSTYGNEAFADYSSILGGAANVAGDRDVSHDPTKGEYSAILGGDTNNTTISSAVVVGGKLNTASGLDSVVLGGQGNTASGNFDIRPCSNPGCP